MKKVWKEFRNFLAIFFQLRQRPRLNEPLKFYMEDCIIRSRVKKFLYGFLPISYYTFRKSKLREKVWELWCNERIVEIPFVYCNLDLPKGSRILDFGCMESKVSLELASLGYKVIGIDLLDYEFNHPIFKFIRGDLLKQNFPSEYFDCVIAISTIEHVGLGDYCEKNLEEGDKEAVEEVHRILEKEGIFMLTVPFGKEGATTWYRVYDDKSLRELLKNFVIEREEFYERLDGKYWVPVNKNELLNVESIPYRFGVNGVACIKCRKS